MMICDLVCEEEENKTLEQGLFFFHLLQHGEAEVASKYLLN